MRRQPGDKVVASAAGTSWLVAGGRAGARRSACASWLLLWRWVQGADLNGCVLPPTRSCFGQPAFVWPLKGAGLRWRAGGPTVGTHCCVGTFLSSLRSCVSVTYLRTLSVCGTLSCCGWVVVITADPESPMRAQCSRPLTSQQAKGSVAAARRANVCSCAHSPRALRVAMCWPGSARLSGGRVSQRLVRARA